MGNLARTRDILDRNPGLKWGFVVYRCFYESGSGWVLFMDLLNTRVRLDLRNVMVWICSTVLTGASKMTESCWMMRVRDRYARKLAEQLSA